MYHVPCNKRDPHRGFTLLEVLVYIGVLALTTVVVIVAVAGFGRVYRRVSAAQALARSGAIAMERNVREARNAQSIDQTGSTFGAHPGKLTLLTEVSPGVTAISEFAVVGDGLQLSEDGSVTGTITQEGVVVENLVFRRIQTAQSEAVRIELTLSRTAGLTAQVGTSTLTASFQGTAVLRGSYPL